MIIVTAIMAINVSGVGTMGIVYHQPVNRTFKCIILQSMIVAHF
jgi:hypothetical protein